MAPQGAQAYLWRQCIILAVPYSAILHIEVVIYRSGKDAEVAELGRATGGSTDLSLQISLGVEMLLENPNEL